MPRDAVVSLDGKYLDSDVIQVFCSVPLPNWALAVKRWCQTRRILYRGWGGGGE